MTYGLMGCFSCPFLHFECGVDMVGKFEGVIVVVVKPLVFEESKISEVEDFRLLFLLLLNLDITA